MDYGVCLKTDAFSLKSYEWKSGKPHKKPNELMSKLKK